MLPVFLASLAGFFAGVSLTLIGAFLHARREFGKTERERMLWVNKALVREGHAPIFSAELIDGAAADQGEHRLPQALRIASPFAEGIRRKSDEITASRKNPDVGNIPESVRQRIKATAAGITLGNHGANTKAA